MNDKITLATTAEDVSTDTEMQYHINKSTEFNSVSKLYNIRLYTINYKK